MSDKDVDKVADAPPGDGESDESATDTAPEPEGARGTRLSRLAALRTHRFAPRVIATAAAVVLGAAIGSSVLFYLQDKDHRAVLDAHEDARQAACAYAPVVATYDAKHLDQYVRNVLAGATGDWKKQFESSSKDLSDVLAKGEVVSKSTDVQCALRTGDRTSAEAIVVIGQTITSTGTQGKPEPGQLSMVMRLEKDGDRWLVNKINTPLTAPPQS
ncbi:hypothetical protein [Nocardia blacklockiae]|uniref:hypothetical protein n=1 Tax=Nocardia blacklockiae TaxID=480036 RepID=UPI0018954151|nr:hypothetical protein [Nocardia blacklockiae]MBF6169917.1 hypothetical protein [Nocardia blacklockiae]